MPTYRVEEVDDGYGIFGLVVAVTLIAILIYAAIYIGIPALIIWIIYKLVKRHKRKKQEAIEAEQAAILADEQKREEAQNYATTRLLELNTLLKEGILTKEQYDNMAQPLIKNLDLVENYEAD